MKKIFKKMSCFDTNDDAYNGNACLCRAVTVYSPKSECNPVLCKNNEKYLLL